MFRRTPKQAAANELGDPTLLAAESIFSAKEIQSLQLRFRRLLQGSDSTIVAARLLHEPEFQCHALAPLLLRHGRLDFDAFLRLLTVLHPTKTSLVAKRSALFHLYDVDADGVVSASDMKSALQRLRPDGSIDDVLDNDVAATFHSVPSQSGLSPDAFAQLVSDDDVLAALSMVCPANVLDGTDYGGAFNSRWQYLHCLITTFDCTVNSVDNAVAHGNLPVVQFLLTHRHEGCARDVVVQKALEGCQLHAAEYLLALGYPFPTSMPFVGRMFVGKPDILGVLQLLVKHGASWDDAWMVFACSRNNASLVQFLHERTLLLLAHRRPRYAICNDAWHVVDYLLGNCLQVISIGAIQTALRHAAPELRRHDELLQSAVKTRDMEAARFLLSAGIGKPRDCLLEIAGQPTHVTTSQLLLPYCMDATNPLDNVLFLLDLVALPNRRRSTILQLITPELTYQGKKANQTTPLARA